MKYLYEREVPLKELTKYLHQRVAVTYTERHGGRILRKEVVLTGVKPVNLLEFLDSGGPYPEDIGVPLEIGLKRVDKSPFEILTSPGPYDRGEGVPTEVGLPTPEIILDVEEGDPIQAYKVLSITKL